MAEWKLGAIWGASQSSPAQRACGVPMYPWRPEAVHLVLPGAASTLELWERSQSDTRSRCGAGKGFLRLALGGVYTGDGRLKGLDRSYLE